MKRPYPKDRCIDPPLKSTVIDECGKSCKSTVMMINDMSSDMFGRKNLVNRLRKDHRLLLFNNRGHYNVSYDRFGKVAREGDEGWGQNITEYMPDPVACKEQHGIDAYTIDMLVHDAKRVMDKHGVDKADVVGFSLGAFIGQALAAKHPERVGKLAIGKAFTRYNDVIRMGKDIVSGPIFQGGYWIWCNARPKIYKSERDYGCNLPLSVLDQYARHILDLDLTKFQLDIKAPTLVVECSDDSFLGTPVQHITNARKEIIPDCGHVFHNGNEKMYDAVEKFLKS